MSDRLDRLQKHLADVTRPIAFLGVIGMLAVAGVTVIDVLLRWLANTAILALNEIVAMIFAVAIAAAIPSGLASGVNLRVDLLARWITGRLSAWLTALGSVLLLGFFALLAWQIGLYAHSLAVQGRTTVILGWPQAPFMYAVAVLLGLGVVVQAVVCLNALRRAIGFVDAAGTVAPPRIVTALAALIGLAVAALAVYGIVDFAGMSGWAESHIGATVAIAFVLMWIFMLAEVPLACVMGFVGIVGSALFIGFAPTSSAFATESVGFLTNSQVATLPLFLMMGSFAGVSDMSSDLYRLAHVLLSRFKGGLALATIGACAGFGALTGSSLATAATIGRVALPEMRARGYSPALTTGCCAAGGTLGALVPPSGPLVVFALLTEASVGRLFVAAFLPAMLAVALYFVTVRLYVQFAPQAAPPVRQSERGELWSAIKGCRAVGLLFGAVLGGLYFGLFTDTESAAVGAFGAFTIALLRGKLRRSSFFEVIGEVVATTAMIYGLIFGAQIFSFFVGVSALTESITAFVRNLHWAPLAVMALLLLLYLVLGSLMESFAVMVITVPIITPLVQDMGYDLIWWGIIMLCVVETGLIHPPLGLNVFVLKSMVPDVPLWTIYKGVFPFVAADLVKLVILVAFPGITLFLATTMHQ